MRSTHKGWKKSGKASWRRWKTEQHLRGVGRFEYAELEEKALCQSNQHERWPQVEHWERKGAGKVSTAKSIPMPELALFLSLGKASAFLRFLLEMVIWREGAGADESRKSAGDWERHSGSPELGQPVPWRYLLGLLGAAVHPHLQLAQLVLGDRAVCLRVALPSLGCLLLLSGSVVTLLGSLNLAHTGTVLDPAHHTLGPRTQQGACPCGASLPGSPPSASSARASGPCGSCPLQPGSLGSRPALAGGRPPAARHAPAHCPAREASPEPPGAARSAAQPP